MVQHDLHMKMCHEEAKPTNCTEIIKNRWIFMHSNSTHHECALLSDNLCSSSDNAFENQELCEKACHHDDHHKMSSKNV